MPKSIQEKVLKRLSTMIEEHGLEAIKVSYYANTGRLSIQHEDKVGELGSVTYDFQDDTQTFKICIKGKYVPAHSGNPNYHDFYMDYTNANRYEEFERTFDRSLNALSIKGQKRKLAEQEVV